MPRDFYEYITDVDLEFDTELGLDFSTTQYLSHQALSRPIAQSSDNKYHLQINQSTTTLQSQPAVTQHPPLQLKQQNKHNQITNPSRQLSSIFKNWSSHQNHFFPPPPSPKLSSPLFLFTVVTQSSPYVPSLSPPQTHPQPRPALSVQPPPNLLLQHPQLPSPRDATVENIIPAYYQVGPVRSAPAPAALAITTATITTASTSISPLQWIPASMRVPTNIKKQMKANEM